MSASSIWRQRQKHGERLQTYDERQQEQVSVGRIQLPDARHDHDQRKGVSMDGGMVNIRGEGWRELKVGTGMRWNAHNANRMIVIRSAVLGNDFHALWNVA